MRVTMLVTMTGTRDGQPWPARGETVDLPADEASSYIDAGLCAAAEKAAPIEAAAVEPAETATAPKPRKR